MNSMFTLWIWIINTTISGNSAEMWGGGIENEGTLHIRDSAIFDNWAEAGGGGIFSLGTLTVDNTAIYDNSTGDRGGGIFTWYTVDISNSTIVSNSAPSGGGGGIYNLGTVNVENTIIANNAGMGSPSNCFNILATVNSRGHNLESGSDCGFTGTGDQQNVDPQLGPLALNGQGPKTHTPLNGSPALDAGSCSGAAVDQRGLARPVDLAGVANVDDACDIGAHERQSDEWIAENADWTVGVEHDFGADVNVSITPNTADDPGSITVHKQIASPDPNPNEGELAILWTLSASNDTYDLDLEFCYTPNELGQVPEDTLQAYRWDENSQTWQNIGGTVDPDTHCVTVSNVTALSQWTVAGDGYVALNKTVAPTTSLIEQGAVTYTINLHNLDSITYTNTLLSDTLPGEVEFSGWIVQPSGAAINVRRPDREGGPWAPSS